MSNEVKQEAYMHIDILALFEKGKRHKTETTLSLK